MVRFEATSRRDLCGRLGLSKGSITRLVDGLLDAGLIVEGDKVDHPRRGRKTTSLRVRSDLAYVLGADLEGMAVRACLLDSSRQVVASGERAVDPSWSMGRIVKTWTSLIERMISQSGVARKRIAGLGVGLPGQVSRDGIRIHAYLPPGRWVDSDLSAALARFGLPVTAANNVICGSEYERRLGLGRQVRTFVSVLVRYGIGAAIYADETFLIGEGAFAGELSHMRLDVKGPACVCGRRGCLDVFASGRTWPRADVRTGARWGRELGKRSRYLAIGLANLLKLFPSPVVILNGIYNAYEAQVRPVLVEALEEELGPLGIGVPEVLFGRPVAFKTSIGAAFRAADAFLEGHLEKNVFRGTLAPPRRGR